MFCSLIFPIKKDKRLLLYQVWLQKKLISYHICVFQALEGLCRIYEEQLKRENPHQQTITYDISQLFDYIDGLTDLSVLVYDKTQSGYSPFNKEWIKASHYYLFSEKLTNLLTSTVTGPINRHFVEIYKTLPINP